MNDVCVRVCVGGGGVGKFIAWMKGTNAPLFLLPLSLPPSLPPFLLHSLLHDTLTSNPIIFSERKVAEPVFESCLAVLISMLNVSRGKCCIVC